MNNPSYTQNMKRIILSAITMIMALTAQAQQKNYAVTGTVQAGTKKVYIVDAINRNTPIDSATVTNGRFALNGSRTENAVLGIAANDVVLLFINDGTPIEAALETLTLKGSEQNQKLNAYDRELTPIDQQMAQIVAQARSRQMSQQQMDSLGATYMALDEQKTARLLDIIRQNADNMIPAAFIGDLAYNLDYAQLQEFCKPTNAYYDHPAMQLPRRLMENMEKRATGKLFTDMTIKDLQGNDRQLSEWIGKGKYVMIDFWASWCGPCRQEMPNVVLNYTKYHDAGFEIIGISFDQRDAPWRSAVNQMHMTWPQLSDLGGWQSSAAGVYGISSIPASILFNGEGRIVAIDLRGEKLGQKLKEIYGF